jgi:outer membrane lipoprotein SlyB
MNKISRTATFATGAIALALLGACASDPYQNTSTTTSSYPAGTSYPAPVYNTPYPNQPAYGGGYGSQQAGVEYGRITNVDVMRTQAQRETSPAGAIIGGIVGGVLGNQIGGGSGRSAATAVGVVGGAIAGNEIGKRNGTQAGETFRVNVQVDNGTMRSYDVPALGDLRAGDRVRIENGTLFRM